MKFVAVDIGASGTRYATQDGQFNILPNNIAFAEHNINGDKVEVIKTPIAVDNFSSELMDNLEVMIEAENNNSKFFPIHAIMGNIAINCDFIQNTPSTEPKAKQRINYVSMLTAVAIARMENKVDEDLYLYVALPPSDYLTGRDILNENITGKFSVKFMRLPDTPIVTFNIIKVRCAQESYMAVNSFLFDISGTFKKEYLKYASRNILSIDIGASTTDLAIISEGRFVDKSAKSIGVGGNTVRTNVMHELRKRGIISRDYTDIEMNPIMQEGRIPQGMNYKIIGDIINECKEKVAIQINNAFQNYFTTIQFTLDNIAAVLVSGGGSMPSSYFDDNNKECQTSVPISVFISRYLQNLCPGIAVLNYTDDSPRKANIKGLYIRANFDMKKGKT